MNFLRNILKKKILINILLITLCFFTITDVKAETDYYDGNGNLFRLVFDDTPLRYFVKNDFAIVYDDIVRSKTSAKFTKTNNGNEFVSAYRAEKELYITMYETTESYQQNNNIKYVVNISPDITASTIDYGINWLNKTVFLNAQNLFTNKGRNKKTTNTGIDQLEKAEIASTESSYQDYGWTQEAYGGLLLAVDKEGNVERIVNLTENYYNLMVEIRDNARKNIFYSSTNVYDKNGKILISKDEFNKRIITSNYSLTCDDENAYIYDLHFDITDLKTNDNVVISYNNDSILLNETLTEQKSIFSIENAKTGNYNVKVYDESSELIHENNFNIEIERNINVDYSLGCDEDNPFFYNIYFNIKGLVKNDKVIIKKDNIKIKESLINWDTTGEEIIDIQNAESGKYLIIIYNEDNEEIYQKEFDIIVDQVFFTEDDTAVSLIDKIKEYLKSFKNNLKIFYEGFESIFNSLNFELKAGIFIIITIFIIVYIIKIIL